MTVEATSIAWEAKLPPQRKLVLLYLSNMGDEIDIRDIKPEKIAQFAGINVDKIEPIIHGLIRSGHIHQWSPDGKMTWIQVTTPHEVDRG